MRVLAALLIAAACAPAAAQDRSAAQVQSLVQLARTLGEAHALRIVCEGRDDQRWRNRMARVVELEEADARLEARLKESFNGGYLEAEQAYVDCDDRARARVLAVARRGRDLAGGLAGGRMETAASR